MNNSANVLFYSRMCKLSTHVLNILENENLLSHFKLFCVEDNINSIPNEIKKVPSMIVIGVDKILVEHEIFKWIEQYKFLKKNITLMKQQNNNNGGNNNSDPIGWIENEMSKISDSYAYKDVDKAMSHSYANANDQNTDIYTPKESAKKINTPQQLNMITNIRNERVTQDNHYDTVNKKYHSDTLHSLRK